jgi:ATP-dependent helicase/nuclease subunit A
MDLADRVERERIRTSLDETLVVEAAAGTGKTTELVTRLINVLAEGRGQVQSIAAVTFTDKAAGELKLRLRAGLERERRATSSGDRRRHLEDAIARLEEARIGTIHAFCTELLRERPVEAGVDPGFQVIAEPEAEALYGRAFSAWIQDQLQSPDEGVRRALRRPFPRESGPGLDDSPITRLRDAGWDLVRWRHLRAPWHRPPFDRAVRIDALIDRLHTFADHLATCGNPRRDTLYQDAEAARRLSADTRLVERIQPRDYDALEAALIDLAHDKLLHKRRRGSDRHYLGAVSRDDLLQERGLLLAALGEFERDADADLAACLHQALLATLDRYEALKDRQGALDFTDLLVRTRDMLRDRRDVRQTLQQRLTHLFVDEFQDTDPLQAEIVLLLAANDPAASEWRKVVPIPGRLFLVGDPKQSIYRFRGADVGAYQEVKTRLCAAGASLLHLSTSFRSVPAIQRLVNRAFAPVMNEDPRTLQAAYVPLAPHREALTQPAVVVLPVPKPYGRDDLAKTVIRQSQPDAIAAFVDWLLNDSRWVVTERDSTELVPIQARHVCLLLRQFSAWGDDLTRPYVDALEARSIPHLLVGGKSFHLREEVETLRTALTAIEWPDDELSVYATLKGSLLAIGDEELLEWRHRFGRLHAYLGRSATTDPVPDHLAAIPNALALLRDLHRRRNYRPVEETIHDLLAATRADAGFVLRPRGEQVLANVMRLADLARTYETTGGLSFRGFIERLRDEAAAAEEAPEAPIVEEGSEGVRIMTVHKAKGLEFPVVILGDMTANLGPNRATRHIDIERDLCALRLAGWSPWDLLDHEADEVARDRAEGVRIAYVAATRARDLLVIPAVGDDPFERGWQYADDAWIASVQRVVYPPVAARRSPLDAPGCPSFGGDTVVDRPAGASAGPSTVVPGRYSIGETDHDRYDVIWWDPHCLRLDVPARLGVAREDLIVDTNPDTIAASTRAYQDWRQDRDHVVERGRRPSIQLETVVQRARRLGREADGAAADITIVDAASDIRKPGGRRFGTLVHAVLATIPLDATPEQVAEVTEAQARIIAAPPEESDAARRMTQALLVHPLLLRAREAWKAGKCRREAPVAWVEPDGVLVEGVLDLAFEDDTGWTVIDFKTDRELSEAQEQYRRQAVLYTIAVATATGKKARGMLVRL